MSKSQKKIAVLNSKSQGARNPSKEAKKTSVKGAKTNKAQPKATKITEKARTPGRGSKQSRILALLKRPEGATVDEMAKATGWQRHSVQGMMSGALKKKLGLTIASEKEERGRVYRITSGVSRS